MNEVKQMKKRKRALQKACSLFIMFMLTLTTLKAVGGPIDIHLKDFPNAEKAGVTFTLYKVGSMSDDGKAALYEKYDMHLPDTAEELQKVAKELTQKTDKETIGKRTTDEKGYLSFTNIENGIYLLVPSDMESYGTIDPFIVTLPMYEEIANVIQGPSYYLQVEPKALPNEAEKPKPPVDPEHPNKPITPEHPEQPDIPTQPNKPGTSTSTTDKKEEPKKETTSTQTGDATHKDLYILFIMLYTLGMFILYNKHKRGSELDDEK